MEFYHLLNRGVEKRDIVADDSDCLRFVHSLFIFNDRNQLDENHRRPGATMVTAERDPLVLLHAWCLMNNHYHLLVSPLKDETDISKFMKKLNMGYARYFNERHERSGYLWQGRYKKLLVKRDEHFVYLPYYIHLNPLDYIFKEWRQGRVRKPDAAIEYLRKYRWSSFLDYQNKSNFGSVVDTKLLKEVLCDPQHQLQEIKRIITTPEIASQANAIE